MFRRKRQEHARFMDDALKTRSIKIFECWNSVVVFHSPNKILATRLVALLVLPKDLVVCF